MLPALDQGSGTRALVVIPARGGSKGIPRKNVRMLAGHPLITYAIRAARAAETVDRVVVTTDDEEISAVAARAGAEVVRRPDELAGDTVTLDPVIYHAVCALESSGYRPEIVITVQATSPLLHPKTIDRAVELLSTGQWDTVISAVDDTHLSWTRGPGGEWTPMYAQRVNRQALTPVYRETGGVIGCRRDVLTEATRIGARVTLIELDREEAVDIDTFFDWWIAEKMLQRRHVVLRVDGGPQIGLGHVYRCLALASRLTDHRVTFLMDARHPLGIELVRQRHFPLRVFEGDALAPLDSLDPDIIINDILDTKREYIRALNERDLFVVNLEDLGPGALDAGLVINALYDDYSPRQNQLGGAEYDCLREEFLTVEPKVVDGPVAEVLVTFGGTDPNNLTAKTLRALDRVPGEFAVTAILGLGYSHEAELAQLLPKLAREPRILRNVQSMSDHIRSADMVVTSAGRTVLEIAAVGTPCLVLCQNQREMRHLHARSDYGIINLGLGTLLSDEELTQWLEKMIQDDSLRREMNRRMLSMDIRGGCERVVEAILAAYRAFERDH
jgi:CMP-N-acetylneuraminic acid synthetase/spore coat polysaccharide biosynthesis predicted glycosyltransferase SpsG